MIAFGRHGSSSANPYDSQQDGVDFGAGVAAIRNKHLPAGKIRNLMIIAASCTFGEPRKGYHKSLSEMLIGELDKDLAGRSVHGIEKAHEAA